jgi:large subunit ribosomal protein L4
MTSAQVLDLKGKKLHEVGLDDEIFGIEPNQHVMHTALVRQLANARSGSANTKTRSEVRGGGKKPWRQKGTGRARAGSIRSPLWEGGGVTFGPKPRDFSKSMPKKQRVLALKSALAVKRDDLVVIDNFADIKNGKTKEFATALKQLNIHEKKVVVILDNSTEDASRVQRAARNIAGVTVLHVTNLNVKDLLHAQSVLLTEGALEAINNRLKGLHKENDSAKDAEPKKAKKATAEKKKAVTKKPTAKKASADKGEKKTAKKTTKKPE